MRGVVRLLRAVSEPLILLAVLASIWVFTPAHAETVGYRIEVRSCRGADCKLLPVSKRRWRGQFACQMHADLIERLGDAPRGRTLSVRCVPVDGVAGA